MSSVPYEDQPSINLRYSFETLEKSFTQEKSQLQEESHRLYDSRTDKERNKGKDNYSNNIKIKTLEKDNETLKRKYLTLSEEVTKLQIEKKSMKKELQKKEAQLHKEMMEKETYKI